MGEAPLPPFPRLLPRLPDGHSIRGHSIGRLISINCCSTGAGRVRQPASGSPVAEPDPDMKIRGIAFQKSAASNIRRVGNIGPRRRDHLHMSSSFAY